MWLVGRLAPDLKTIVLFWRGNGAAIQAACRQFGLFAGAVAAIDGSKFVNNRDRNFTVVEVAKRLERADREPKDIPEARVQRIGEKIAKLRRQMAFLRQMQSVVEASDGGEVSLTDPDALDGHKRTGHRLLGYNVQIAVDPEHQAPLPDAAP